MFKLPCSSRERQSALGNGITRASLVAQMIKHLPAMRETWVRSWVGKIPWRRKWQPTPLFLPGEFHGQRSLAGYSSWGCKESDTTEQLTHTHAAAFQAPLSSTVYQSLLKTMSIVSVMHLTVLSSATLYLFAFGLFSHQDLFQ